MSKYCIKKFGDEEYRAYKITPWYDWITLSFEGRWQYLYISCYSKERCLERLLDYLKYINKLENPQIVGVYEVRWSTPYLQEINTAPGVTELKNS